MEALGNMLKRAEESVAKRKMTYEHDFTTCRSYPQVNEDPLDVFRKSLDRVTQKAKEDFIDCAYQTSGGDKVHHIVSFVPQTEACYAMLGGDHISFDFDEKEFQAMFDKIWLAFLGWMKEQGLVLWMGPYRNKFGIRNFVLLEAFVRTKESVDAEREKMASGLGTRTARIPRFID